MTTLNCGMEKICLSAIFPIIQKIRDDAGEKKKNIKIVLSSHNKKKMWNYLETFGNTYHIYFTSLSVNEVSESIEIVVSMLSLFSLFLEWTSLEF
jgi:hypothetical protein